MSNSYMRQNECNEMVRGKNTSLSAPVNPMSANSVAVYKSLDIDSTYRNRNQYANPNSFVIPINFSGRTSSPATSIDPIVDSVPYTGSLSKTPGMLQIGVGSTTTTIILDPEETTIENFYVNSYLEVDAEFSIITSYDAFTQTAIVSPPFSVAPVLAQIYYTRKSRPFFVGTVDTSVNTTSSSFALDPSASTIVNQYQNSYLRFTSGQNINQTLRVDSYSGFSRIVTLSGFLPFSVLPGDAVELSAFSRDNASTLFSVGNTNKAIYECELKWLSVPNQVLNVGYGGTVANYPYLYVKLFNEGNQLSSQVLYSNNPSSSNVLFKVPVNEYFGIENGQFITLKDSKSLQTISLNPDQDMRFEVTLPTGEILQFATSDNLTPSAPNPFLQINALFTLRKISSL